MPSTHTIRRRSAPTAALVANTRATTQTPINPAPLYGTKKFPNGSSRPFPAVDGDTLLVGSAAAGFTKKPKFQLIAYSLS
jgi:hypothetical protein